MESFASYLPASVFNYLLEETNSEVSVAQPPFKQTYSTCVLFADISGFTALCEAMSMKYPKGGGDEFLAKRINSYFELLLRTLSSQGGDVFKFAGDAILVVWPPSDEDLTTRTRRAAQSALEVKKILSDANIGAATDTVALNVKIGVGVGEITILHVGGVFGRMEYLATGAPLVQAFHAEHQADKKDAVISAEAWALVEPYFHAEIREEKDHKGDGPAHQYAFLVSCEKPLRKVSVHKRKDEKPNVVSPAVLRRIMNYVPGAIVPWVAIAEERWASELRRVTVLFVNVGMKESELANISANNDVITVQRILQAVQHAVYKFEGSLNKFLMDDKGSTLIAVFGLPPLAHEDDTVRGVLSALTIVTELRKLGMRPAIGVTSGMAFCGVVGKSGSRREYSVLGDTVNLSARLMQHATVNGMSVLCDQITQQSAKSRINFDFCSKITVKGKMKPVSTYKPVPQTENRLLASLSALAATAAASRPASALSLRNGAGGARGSASGSLGVGSGSAVPPMRRLGSGIATSSVMLGRGILEAETHVVSGGLKSTMLTTAQENPGLTASVAAGAPGVGAIAGALPAANAPDSVGDGQLVPVDPFSNLGSARSKSRSISVAMPVKRLTQANVVMQRIFSRDDEATDNFGHQAKYIRAPSERPGVADLTSIAVSVTADLLALVPAKLRTRSAYTSSLADGVASPSSATTSLFVPVFSEADDTLAGIQIEIGSAIDAGFADIQSVLSAALERLEATAAQTSPLQLQPARSTGARQGHITGMVYGSDTEGILAPAETASAVIEFADIGSASASPTSGAGSASGARPFVLLASYASLHSAGLGAIDDTVHSRRFRASHQARGTVLALDLPLHALTPLLHAQNLRTAALSNVTGDSPDFVRFAKNPILSLSLARAPDAAEELSFLANRRDRIAALGLSAAACLNVDTPLVVKRVTPAAQSRSLANGPVGLASISIDLNAPPSMMTINAAGKRTQSPSASSTPSLQPQSSTFLTAVPQGPLKGRVVLVEGEMGVGKSLLLDLVMDSSLFPALVVSANPLDTRRLSLWGSMLYQLLEAELLIARQLAEFSGSLASPLFGPGEVPATPSSHSNLTLLASGNPPTVTEGNEDDDEEVETALRSQLTTVLTTRDLSDHSTTGSTGEPSTSRQLSADDSEETARLQLQERVLVAAARERRTALTRRFGPLFADCAAQAEMEPALYAMHGQLEGKHCIPDEPLPVITPANYERYICVLGDILPEMQFEPTPEVEALTSAQRFLLLEVFIFTWLRSAATRCGLAIAVDSAVHMDASSWAVCAAMPFAVPNVLLVVATRPINRLHLGAFTLTTPPGYLALCADTDTVKVRLQARSPAMAEEIFIKTMIDAELELADADGFVETPSPASVIAAMPTCVRALIAQTGLGNPLVISQLVQALKYSRMLQFLENYKLDIDPVLYQFPANEVEIPVPVALQAIYGSRLDRLNQTQSMLLKFAACVGNTFTLSIIAQPYPLDVTSAELARELHVLTQLGIIRRVYPGSRRWTELQKAGVTFDNNSVEDPMNMDVAANAGDAQSGGNGGGNGGGDDDHIEFGAPKGQRFKLRVYPDECVYMFSQGFMREMILSRILLEQKSWIIKKIELTYSEELERRSNIPVKSNPYGPGIMHDDLSVRKGRDDSDFKTRHFVLHRDVITVWESEEDYQAFLDRSVVISAGLTAIDKHAAAAAEDASEEGVNAAALVPPPRDGAPAAGSRMAALLSVLERVPLNDHNQFCPIAVIPLHASRVDAAGRGSGSMAPASSGGSAGLAGSTAVAAAGNNEFWLEASRWAKRSNYHSQAQQFVISGNSLAMVNSWRSAVERGCEQAAARAASVAGQKRLRQKVGNLMRLELTKPIQYTYEEQDEARRAYNEWLMHRQTEVLSAQLLVHKKKSGPLVSPWKPRYVVLTAEGLQFRKSAATGLYRSPSQACSLKDGNVRVRSVPQGTYKGHPWVIELTIDLWSKEDTCLWGSRPVVIALPNEAMLVTWMTELERIARHHVHERIRNKFKDMLALSAGEGTADLLVSPVITIEPVNGAGSSGPLGSPTAAKRGSVFMNGPAFGPSHSIGVDAAGKAGAPAETPAAGSQRPSATPGAGKLTVNLPGSRTPDASNLSPAVAPTIKVVARDAQSRAPPSGVDEGTTPVRYGAGVSSYFGPGADDGHDDEDLEDEDDYWDDEDEDGEYGVELAPGAPLVPGTARHRRGRDNVSDFEAALVQEGSSFAAAVRGVAHEVKTMVDMALTGAQATGNAECSTVAPTTAGQGAGALSEAELLAVLADVRARCFALEQAVAKHAGAVRRIHTHHNKLDRRGHAPHAVGLASFTELIEGADIDDSAKRWLAASYSQDVVTSVDMEGVYPTAAADPAIAAAAEAGAAAAVAEAAAAGAPASLVALSCDEAETVPPASPVGGEAPSACLSHLNVPTPNAAAAGSLASPSLSYVAESEDGGPLPASSVRFPASTKAAAAPTVAAPDSSALKMGATTSAALALHGQVPSHAASAAVSPRGRAPTSADVVAAGTTYTEAGFGSDGSPDSAPTLGETPLASLLAPRGPLASDEEDEAAVHAAAAAAAAATEPTERRLRVERLVVFIDELNAQRANGNGLVGSSSQQGADECSTVTAGSSMPATPLTPAARKLGASNSTPGPFVPSASSTGATAAPSGLLVPQPVSNSAVASAGASPDVSARGILRTGSPAGLAAPVPPLTMRGSMTVGYASSDAGGADTAEALGYSTGIADGLDDWRWNVFTATTDDDLLNTIVRMFVSFDILRTYRVPSRAFATFLCDVMDNYAANPYHNLRHAVDVTQTVFAFMTHFAASAFLTPLERFALLMSAFGHDVRHPGTNNLYQVNARTKLALLYNDQSVLEHHHCHILFKLLLKPESNVLVHLTPAEFKDFRSTVTSAILSTDMTAHFSLVEKLNAIIEKLKTARTKARRTTIFPGLLTIAGSSAGPSEFNPMSPARRSAADPPHPLVSTTASASEAMSPIASPLNHRRSMFVSRSTAASVSGGPGSALPPFRAPGTGRGSVVGLPAGVGLPAVRELPLHTFVQGALSATEKAVVLNVILHAADISNAGKQWEQARPWADNVCREFFAQGELEIRHKLPLSPNSLRSETNQAQLNMNFIDFIVAPLYVALRQLLPASRMCCGMLADNRSKWDALNVAFLRDSCFDEAGAEALVTPVVAAVASTLEPGIGSVPVKAFDKAQLISELSKWQRRAESFKTLFAPAASTAAPSAAPETTTATPEKQAMTHSSESPAVTAAPASAPSAHVAV